MFCYKIACFLVFPVLLLINFSFLTLPIMLKFSFLSGRISPLVNKFIYVPVLELELNPASLGLRLSWFDFTHTVPYCLSYFPFGLKKLEKSKYVITTPINCTLFKNKTKLILFQEHLTLRGCLVWCILGIIMHILWWFGGIS